MTANERAALWKRKAKELRARAIEFSEGEDEYRHSYDVLAGAVDYVLNPILAGEITKDEIEAVLAEALDPPEEPTENVLARVYIGRASAHNFASACLERKMAPNIVVGFLIEEWLRENTSYPSRSLQRRQAAQRGQPAPTFSRPGSLVPDPSPKEGRIVLVDATHAGTGPSGDGEVVSGAALSPLPLDL